MAWIERVPRSGGYGSPTYRARHLVSYLVSSIRRGASAPRRSPQRRPLAAGRRPRRARRGSARLRARELAEELALAADFLLPEPLFLTVTETVGATAGHTDVSLWYVCAATPRSCRATTKASFCGVAWFPLAELPLERADPHLARFAEKLRNVVASLA